MGTRRRFIAGGIGAAALAAATLTPSPVGATGSMAKTLIPGLSSPKGLAVNADGLVFVAQGAFGAPGPVLQYDKDAPRRDRVTAITDPFTLIDLAISPLDGTGWAIGAGDATIYHQLADGTIVPVLDMAAYQAGDPDPDDQDVPAFPEETNPYGLTVMDNGDALVADAAGNDIVRVTPDGVATTVARFDLTLVGTDHLPDIPDFAGLPDAITAEAVPTSVTIGPDGAIYVGQLMGFPFRPGTSNVWRIEPDAEGALCSTTVPSAECSVYASDFTAIQDITFNLDKNWLYVYSLGEEGVLAFEEGFATGEFPAAQLFEVRNVGKRNERRPQLAHMQLTQPGGVAIGPDGEIYVTSGIFSTNEDGSGAGRLAKVSH